MRLRFSFAAAWLATSAAAGAQVTPGPGAVPTGFPTPEVFTLPQPGAPAPSPTPTPAATPAPSSTPAAVRTPAAPRSPAAATPTPRALATPAPSPSPTPSVVPTPIATRTPAASAPPAATAPVVPVAPATPPPPPSAPAPAAGGFAPWIAAGAGILLALAAAAFLFRRSRAAAQPATDVQDAIEPAPPVAAVPPVPSQPTDRARIDMNFAPRRAGVNLLTATVDGEIVLRNTGTLPAEQVSLEVRLLSAAQDGDAMLGALFAAPVERLATPTFTLAPGEERRVRTLATLPRRDINVLTAAGRPMFVPVVAASLRYASGAGEAQVGRAWAIGVERAGSAKLAPFWLDVPARMHEAIAARPHALAVES